MRIRLVSLLVLSMWCSGCATVATEAPKASTRAVPGETKPIMVGTAPGGSTRYQGAGEIVGKDTVAVFTVDGYTRLQIGYGKQFAHIDLDDSARRKLIEGLRRTFTLCESAKNGTLKGITEVDKVLGSPGYSIESRGLLEIAFSAIVLPDGSISCADILALKKSASPAENQQAEDYAAIHAIAFSALPHLIDVLERAPHLAPAPTAAQGKF
jgi:hypothetical protein